jgi:hypothetical protein
VAQNIFGTEVPANLNNNDLPDKYSLGTRFQPAVDGQATHGEWYFPITSPSQPVQIGIFRNSDEVLLGSTTFAGGESAGRHQVAFSPAIDLVAGVEYTVAIWSSDTYVSTSGYFASDKTSGDLYCPAVAGRFLVSASLDFPDQSFGNANYWPDLIFVPDSDPAEGSAALGLDLAVAATGARSSSAVAALGLGLAVASSGSISAEGQAAAGLGLAVAASGARPASGTVALSLNLAVSASGVRSASGAAALGLNLTVSASGSNGQTGRPVKPWPGTVVPVSSYPWTPRPVRSFQEVQHP